MGSQTDEGPCDDDYFSRQDSDAEAVGIGTRHHAQNVARQAPAGLAIGTGSRATDATERQTHTLQRRVADSKGVVAQTWHSSVYALRATQEDERIKITGVFDKFSFIMQQFREIRTALLQDVYAHVDGKDLDIGHVWLQNADQLKALNLAFGDRIRCNCRVKTYKKRLMVPNKQGLMVENKLSLAWPMEVEVISRLQSPQTEANEHPKVLVAPSKPSVPPLPPTEVADSISPAKMIVEVRRLAKMAGGMESLQQLIEALRSEA